MYIFFAGYMDYIGAFIYSTIEGYFTLKVHLLVKHYSLCLLLS